MSKEDREYYTNLRKKYYPTPDNYNINRFKNNKRKTFFNKKRSNP